MRIAALIFGLVLSSIALGQSPDPLSIMKRDVGTWDCAVKFYMDSNGEPSVSKAVETNHMVGDLWLIGDFKGEMAGAPFHGSSQTGYDPKAKKFIGSWVDSASPYPAAMEGSYDAAKKTLTMIGTGKDPNGGDMKMKLVTVYKENDTRTMTMYVAAGEEWLRAMVVEYTRKK